MDCQQKEVLVKTKNKPSVLPIKHLTILETCLSGMIMGFIAYSGSFSIVPIVFTSTALLFGSKSSLTIYATAFGQLIAGYLHTHSSRTGMAISTQIFHGFYIAKPGMRNRRRHNETRYQSLKRFFFEHPLNAFVLNFMWQTFTLYYLIQSHLCMRYMESLTNESEHQLLLIRGITRYLAGCLSGMTTAIINHLWQRYLACQEMPHAVFNTDKQKLKFEWKERRKLLSPFNMENWIKVFSMLIGALFILISNVPNQTRFYLLNPRTKRIISDILVINGGWLFVRDGAMLLLKKAEKIPLEIRSSSPVDEHSTTIEDEQSKILTDEV